MDLRIRDEQEFRATGKFRNGLTLKHSLPCLKTTEDLLVQIAYRSTASDPYMRMILQMCTFPILHKAQRRKRKRYEQLCRAEQQCLLHLVEKYGHKWTIFVELSVNDRLNYYD